MSHPCRKGTRRLWARAVVEDSSYAIKPALRVVALEVGWQRLVSEPYSVAPTPWGPHAPWGLGALGSLTLQMGTQRAGGDAELRGCLAPSGQQAQPPGPPTWPSHPPALHFHLPPSATSSLFRGLSSIKGRFQRSSHPCLHTSTPALMHSRRNFPKCKLDCHLSV